jgi:hypothetical protein
MRNRSPAKSAASSPPVPAAVPGWRSSRRRVLGQQHEAQVLRLGVDLVLRLVALLFGEGAHVGSVVGSAIIASRLCRLACAACRVRIGRHHRVELGQFARQGDEGVRVGSGVEGRHDDVVAGENGVEPLDGGAMDMIRPDYHAGRQTKQG